MKYKSKKILFTLLWISGSAGILSAQEETDALRYSFLQPQGTARSIGFGNALGSIGGDFSSLSVNPAGIGIYRNSEIQFTPSLMFGTTRSEYGGKEQTGTGSHFSLSNIGVVWARAEKGKRYERNNWKSISFGFGMNRLADFTRNFSYQGNNYSSSASEVFAEDANYSHFIPNGSDLSSPGFLGYESYLIDRFNNGSYGSFVHYNTGLRQYNSVKERGGISELAFSLGGNYKEQLMIGGTLGIPILRYSRSKSLEETDLSGNPKNGFYNFVYNEDLNTSGMGVNLKLGLIYKPNDLFRVGAAIHSPTVFSLTDIMDAGIVSNTENLKADTFGRTNESPITSVIAEQRQYSYSLTTPWRAVLSAAAFLGKYGFLTVDYEYVDYSRTHFKFSDNSADQDYQQYINGIIQDSYRGASNIRTGLEIRLDQLALRGGFGYYGNPFKNKVYADGRRLDFSAGIGYRVNQFFMDIAFIHHQNKSQDQPYRIAAVAVPTAILRTGQNNFALTIGWKF